jgi:hypothetical protein
MATARPIVAPDVWARDAVEAEYTDNVSEWPFV